VPVSFAEAHPVALIATAISLVVFLSLLAMPRPRG